MSFTGIAIDLVERGFVPDALTRAGIRSLCNRRLNGNNLTDVDFRNQLRIGPIAHVPETANQQHYEVPAEFFKLVLGPHLKYSCAYWQPQINDLAHAEEQALEITCERAEISNGQRILELGCGWGSLSLWMAKQYPDSQIIAVSNSHSQREFIEQQCEQREFRNLKIVTADINTFKPSAGLFDKIVSIEMFEHMRNYEELLRRIATWLTNDGRLFVHIFCHRALSYPFDSEGAANWMGQYFFTGGMMPSADLLRSFNSHLEVEKQNHWPGIHYEKTANAWLSNLDDHRKEVIEVFGKVYGEHAAKRWYHRWRMFFMACSELFALNQGNEWFVSHYLLKHAQR
jgi:cyclopropane-fatty-acyl-phospholipid synthase